MKQSESGYTSSLISNHRSHLYRLTREMRSRTLQPRTLFRIANSAASSSTSSTSATQRVANAAASSSSLAIARPESSKNTNGRTFSSPAFHSRRQSRRHASTTTLPSSSSSPAGSVFASSFPLPVVPVRPPPHSKTSVGLQSFFSQGRPLLEHNNILEGPSNGAQAFVGVAMILSGEVEAGKVTTTKDEGEVMAVVEAEDAEESSSELKDSLLSLPRDLDHLSPTDFSNLPKDLEAQIQTKAEQLLKQMTQLRDDLREASPEEIQKMLKESGGSAEMLLPEEFAEVQRALLGGQTSNLERSSGSGPQFTTLQLHLPPLRDVDQGTFEQMIKSLTISDDAATAASQKPPSALSLFTRLSATLSYESARKTAIQEALARGEDPTLATALGPESDLVILGEPNGPKETWGPGVASWLARFGRAYRAPASPRADPKAAEIKGIEDLTTYHIQAGDQVSAALNGEGIEETQTSMEQRQEEEQEMTPDGEDVALWLSHGLVQNKLKSQLAWDRVESLMDQATSPSKAHLPGTTWNLRSLKAEREVPTMESEGEVVQMDSVRRKKKKKMRKMKYKKLRKRQRAERQRLKK